ncbi:MAG: beta-propeller fold lactonase family protein [Candidatus Hydrogenedentes bacterium]|nr:beta-propeller fold lactonase family protein [Candidatus Hydrogenedentota bacterium]
MILYIAEATANQVAVFSIAKGKVVKTISLPHPPTGLALNRDKDLLYVTCAAPDGHVYVVNLKRVKPVLSMHVGHTPNAPVLSPDGRALYVCNRFSNDVSVLDLDKRKETARIPVLHEPVAAAVTLDGRFLFVANQLPVGPADGDYAAAAVSVIDTSAQEVVKDIQLLNGATGLRGICISPDGDYVYVTHILARYQLPTTQLERGWMNTNALSILDATDLSLVNTVLLDDVDLGAADPWGIACTADGKYLCISHAGTHELSVIDREALHKKLPKPTDNPMVEPFNDLSFMVGLRRRLRLLGNGPRGLAIIGATAYATEYFSDSLAIVDITKTPPGVQSLPLGPKTNMTVARRGEMLFNDAEHCFQRWQSCASCHPGEGRPDALNWDLLNDGLGNPKNTKSLLLSHKTPPAMSTGVRADAKTAVRAGFRHIQFVQLPEKDAAAVDEYLKSLKPVPSPRLVDGKLSKAAKRGKRVFEQARCNLCHSGPMLTDMAQYDVGTGRDSEKGHTFDTPTLVEVWRSAPYLHDGRAATMQEVLTTYNPNDKHGVTSNLNRQEINNLAEFVLSQ